MASVINTHTLSHGVASGISTAKLLCIDEIIQ